MQSEPLKKINIKVIKASDVQSKFHDVKCYVSITIGSGPAQTTKAVRSAHPIWNEVLSFEAHPSSAVTIEIIRRSKFFGTQVIATLADSDVSIPPECFERDFEQTYNLKTSANRTQLVVLWSAAGTNAATPGAGATTETKVTPDVKALPAESSLMPTEEKSTTAQDVVSTLQGLDTMVGHAHREAFRDSGTHTRLATVIGYVGILVNLGDAIAEAHPIANAAWKVLTASQKILQGQIERDEKVQQLWGTIVDTLDFMKDAEPLNKIRGLEKTTEAIVSQLYNCVLHLKKYEERGFLLRTVAGALNPTADAALEEFITSFTDLRVKFDQRVSIDHWKLTWSIKGDISKLLDSQGWTRRQEELKSLKEIPGAKIRNIEWSPEYVCLPATRERLLEDIVDWVLTGSEKLYWLSGAAGTGKSSVANTVAQHFKQLGLLGASFRFRRDEIYLRSPYELFGNLAYQLTFYDEGIRQAIVDVTAERPLESMAETTMPRQLMLEPLQQVQLVQPLVIVIDALDECVTSNSLRGYDSITTMLERFLPELPLFTKILVTSRYECTFALKYQGQALVCQQDLTTLPHTKEDIQTYFHSRFAQIAFNNELREWPTLSAKKQLLQHADNLFIWASVACSAIEISHNPPSELSKLLTQSQQTLGNKSKLDELYHRVLTLNLEDKSQVQLVNQCYVLQALVTLRRPLTLKALDQLLLPGNNQLLVDGTQVDLLSCNKVLPSLRPILNYGDNQVVRLLHKSVYDFLVESAEAPFRVNLTKSNAILGLQCLVLMNSMLKQNICCFANLSIKTRDIPDLPGVIDQHISESLKYACLYFWDHLLQAGDHKYEMLNQELTNLLGDKVLFWIEVMILLEKMPEAEEILRNISLHSKNQDTSKVAEDAASMLQLYGSLLGIRPGQLYGSVLALMPKDCKLYERYVDRFTVNRIESTYPLTSGVALRTLVGHTDSVKTAVFAPDGSQLASASADYTIRLWNIHTGKTIGSALEGHSKDIQTVAFSPDGTKLASASDDKTLCLWNANTGTMIGSPLEGHTNSVCSAVFSPNGTKLASASADNTVRLWDVNQGSAIGFALEGHSDWVRSVVFSPDGTKLASASDDNTVRLWDAQTGAAIGPALHNHSGWVFSVVFSPDGTWLASASADNTVHLWNAQEETGFTFKGHIDRVFSVVFSPNGARLASVSADHTIRLWDVYTGLGITLVGHRNEVTSAVFSPDGSILASASFDHTVRVWNAYTGVAMGSALEGHEGRVLSVAFSPDGTTLASTSQDTTVRLWHTTTVINSALDHRQQISSVVFSPDGTKMASILSNFTICLWNAYTGIMICPPLKGYSNSVASVVFSPDGKILASASHDNNICLWDAHTGIAIGSPLKGHSETVFFMAFSPDGENIVSLSYENTIHLWNVHTAIGFALKGHSEWPRGAVFSPDGTKLASTSEDNTVRLWNTQTGTAIGSALEGHDSKILLVVFSPDGTIIASTSDDNTVCLWNAHTGTAIGSALQGHRRQVYTLVFSPDGRTLASMSDDTTIRLWDVHTGTAIGSALEGHRQSVQKAVFSPDGTKLASASDDNTVRLWDTRTGTSIKVYNNVEHQHFPLLLGLSFDNHGFLVNHISEVIAWLPHRHRGVIVVGSSGIIAVYLKRGIITFINYAQKILTVEDLF